MAGYVVRRLLSGLLLVGLLTFLTYAVYQLIPVDPACLRIDCGPGNHSTPADFAAARHDLGVDRPLPFQYARFVWRFVRHGSLGNAWIGDSPVSATIGHALPITASIVVGGVILLFLLALPLGCYAALRPRTAADRGLLAFSVIGVAIHPFVLAIAIKDIFGYVNLPSGGYCALTGSATGCGGPVEWTTHLLLPWVCFSLFFLPLYLRMIRVRMLETLSEQYVTTARAKGATEQRVVRSHVLRNAMGPLLPMVAADAGTALTAAIYIELVFGLPGLGQLSVRSLSGQNGGYDRAIVVGIVATVGLVVVMLNVISDIGRALLDPRIAMRTPSGLIRMPRFLAESPLSRAPKAVYAGVAAAALAATGYFVYTSGTPQRGIPLALPVKTQALNWKVDVKLNGGPASPGTMTLRVRRAAFGKTGWRLDYALTNNAPVAVQSVPAPVGTPGGAFSLGYNFHDGDFVAHAAVAATKFLPRPPTVLKPGETFVGSIGGIEHVPRNVQYVAQFGEYIAVNAPGLVTYVPTPSAVSPR